MKIAKEVISRKADLIQSNTKYDWVGPGVYFWEADPRRAFEWAKSRCDDGDYEKPAVVGAIIDLRNCLDLLNRADQELVRMAHESLVSFYDEAKISLPKNLNSKKGGDKDRRARALDCDVITHLHWIMDSDIADEMDNSGKTPFFDTVRGMFTEGSELYPGAAFYHQSHVQIAVRNLSCIRGVFYPPELDHLISY